MPLGIELGGGKPTMLWEFSDHRFVNRFARYTGWLVLQKAPILRWASPTWPHASPTAQDVLPANSKRIHATTRSARRRIQGRMSDDFTTSDQQLSQFRLRAARRTRNVVLSPHGLPMGIVRTDVDRFPHCCVSASLRVSEPSEGVHI